MYSSSHLLPAMSLKGCSILKPLLKTLKTKTKLPFSITKNYAEQKILRRRGGSICVCERVSAWKWVGV